MRRLLWVPLFAFFSAGCQKSDTETLARIGRKLADRREGILGEVRSCLDLNWRAALKEHTLEERVRLRLRFDKDLGDLPLDVKVTGADVELSGKLPHPEQKRRILELVESTRGVEHVTADALLID